MSYNDTNTTRGNGLVTAAARKTIYNVYCAIEIIVIVVGTSLNLWFLVAILRSRDMHSRLRTKIILNSLVIHLVDSMIILPAYVVNVLSGFYINCLLGSIMSNLHLIIDFITNWLLVILIVVFIAQIQDFNPSTKLTPRAVTVCTVGLLVIPWIASLVVVPIIVHEYYIREKWVTKGCSYPTWDSMEILKYTDTLTPMILAVVLVIIAAGLKCRRFTREYTTDSMQTELISRVPEIDNILAYVAAVVVSTLCDLLHAIVYIDAGIFQRYNQYGALILWISSWVLTDLRAILMPLVWLLLADVRQHIRTWRPWYRADLGIDLTVTYRKDEA